MSLPFKTPEPEQFIEIGDEKIGKIKLPVYGGLLTGEAVEVAKLFQKIAKELKKEAREITGEDVAPYKPELALIAFRYRYPEGGRITLKKVMKLPWSVVDPIAQLMLAEITADAIKRAQIMVESDEEEGEKKVDGQPPN